MITRLSMSTFLLLTGLSAPGFAQGLIWHLPEDGAWVRYEGDYRHEVVRPESAEGNLVLQWNRHTWIKSVGTEVAEYNGQSQPCRWIEIKVITGKPSERGLDPGPIGEKIYKLLVPESKIVAGNRDGDSILVSMIPIVKGYKRLGKDAQEQVIKARAMRTYPTLSLLTDYKDLEEVAASDDPNVPVGPIDARRMKGRVQMERETSRSINEAEFWISKDVPFGLARWIVKSRRLKKDLTDPRSEFADASITSVEMKLLEIGTDARSEIARQ